MTNTCWNWLGELSGSGYGRITIDSKKISAHRYFYETIIGEIPKGLELDHLCSNKKCVNPLHLEPVTRSENMKRAGAIRVKNRPNCPKGHEYNGKNLYINKDRKNNKMWRACRKCRALWMREDRKRKKLLVS